MTGEAWRRHLQTYVALRRAIGFTMRPEARLLQDFVEHLERRGHGAPVAQVAVEWASASAESQHARRLSIVRGFLTMVRAAEPDVDVPGAGLVRTSKRPTPRILEPHEILALMEAARSLGPRDTLRPHTVATVIGLLASCGLRASEAIRLDVDHVDLADDLPCLQIQRTKFRKSRLVPLHPTTAAALRTYAQQRRALGYDGLCSAFFGLSSNGCGWVEARSAGRRGVLAARVASELTAHGVHLTGGGRGAPWPGVGRSGVAAGRPACQRATRVLRCATALRVTHRPSLRSSSRYGPCGPAWTGASRPSTTTRKARRLAVRG